jgi:hypothetical protein
MAFPFAILRVGTIPLGEKPRIFRAKQQTPIEIGDGGRWQAPHPLFVPEMPLGCGACHRPPSPIQHRFSNTASPSPTPLLLLQLHFSFSNFASPSPTPLLLLQHRFSFSNTASPSPTSLLLLQHRFSFSNFTSPSPTPLPLLRHRFSFSERYWGLSLRRGFPISERILESPE